MKKSEKFAKKIISDAREILKDYLEEDFNAKPRIGIGYFSHTWKKILENFDDIKAEGERRNLIVEFPKNKKTGKYLYFEYKIEMVNKK